MFLSRSPDGAHSDESTPDPSQAIYAEFDDDFEDEELTAPIGQCTAMYNFPGMSQAVSWLPYNVSDDSIFQILQLNMIYLNLTTAYHQNNNKITKS